MCGAASPWETRLHQPGGSEHVAKRGQHRYRRPGFGGLPLPGGLSTAPGVVTALEPGSWVAWHAWWSRGSAFDWEFVLSESDGGTHLVQRTAWHTALLFAVLASRLAPPATNTSRESPQPQAHQGQPGRRRASIHAWSGTLEMTASAVSPPFLICELRRFCSGSPSSSDSSCHSQGAGAAFLLRVHARGVCDHA